MTTLWTANAIRLITVETSVNLLPLYPPVARIRCTRWCRTSILLTPLHPTSLPSG